MAAEEPTLTDLFAELQEAKAIEASAKEARLAVENQIVAHVKDAPEKGSRTLKAGAMRCSVKFDLSYKADMPALCSLSDSVPQELLPVKLTQPKYELDVKKYEALRTSHPEVFSRVAACVEVKPSKPSLTLKF